jgi:hypothetical protein
MEVIKMTRLTVLCTSLIVISLILAGQSSAKINEKNIMGAWLFDKGSGKIAKDSSPNGFDGEVVGAKWEKNGKFGRCLEFSGVAGDNYVDCGEDDKLDYMGDGNFSITAWVKVLTNDADWHNLVSKKVGYNNTDMGWMAWYDFRDAGAIQLRINDGTTVNDNTPNAPDKTLMGQIQDGEWHHIGWVITEPGKLIYYFDGDNKGEGSFSMKDSTENDVTLRIGNSEGNSKGLHCLMDEVGIFNVSLTADDIASLMGEGITAAVSPLGKLTSTWGDIKQ